MKRIHILITVLIATLAGVGAAYIANQTLLYAQGQQEPQPVLFYQGNLPSFCQQQMSMRVYVYAGAPDKREAQVPIALWMCVR